LTTQFHRSIRLFPACRASQPNLQAADRQSVLLGFPQRLRRPAQVLHICLRPINAEGISAAGGYGPQNKDGLIDEALNSKGFKRLYSPARLKQWKEENLYLPGNDQVCKEAVILTQNVLLGSRQDMDDIVNAVTKIYENRASLLG
jgi:hypothetical protein